MGSSDDRPGPREWAKLAVSAAIVLLAVTSLMQFLLRLS